MSEQESKQAYEEDITDVSQSLLDRLFDDRVSSPGSYDSVNRQKLPSNASENLSPDPEDDLLEGWNSKLLDSMMKFQGGSASKAALPTRTTLESMAGICFPKTGEDSSHGSTAHSEMRRAEEEAAKLEKCRRRNVLKALQSHFLNVGAAPDVYTEQLAVLESFGLSTTVMEHVLSMVSTITSCTLASQVRDATQEIKRSKTTLSASAAHLKDSVDTLVATVQLMPQMMTGLQKLLSEKEEQQERRTYNFPTVSNTEKERASYLKQICLEFSKGLGGSKDAILCLAETLCGYVNEHGLYTELVAQTDRNKYLNDLLDKLI